jgi:diacylglycerol O-acyltransferase / wax synthase
MTRLALPDATFFALESPARPMHAGALMLFDPPAGEPATDFAARLVAEFRSVPPVAPFNRRPDLALGRLPRWVTVDAVDLDYHVRHIALPAPGTPQQLMELVGHLYVALLDRSRPLWECYVIEGLQGGAVAVFYKLHHALADGISGARLLVGPLSSSATHRTIRPIWAPRPAVSRPTSQAVSPNRRDLLKPLRVQLQTIVGVVRRLVEVILQIAGLKRDARALPFSSPRLAADARRQSPSRSFAIFDLPLSEARRVAEQVGGSVNDVILAVCDDAMNRYLAANGEKVTGPLVASIAVSTRASGDDAPSNAVALAQVRLGVPDASPRERLEQIVTATSAVKRHVRGSSRAVLELETIAYMAGSQMREALPASRRLVPSAANIVVSNMPGATEKQLYLGGARMTGMYAAPIVPPSHLVNFTLVSYLDALCFGVGAAANVIPDTARIAELARQSFAELAETVTPRDRADRPTA